MHIHFNRSISHRSRCPNLKKREGFTLIELLIVIAVIAIIAGVVFVALDPLTRFQDARDSKRVGDITELLNAIKVDQVDNEGAYLTAITNMTAGSVYMIVDGASMTAGCDDNNTNCDTNVTSDTTCVNLAGLVTEGYLGSVPISPTGSVTWDDGDTAGEEGTGYTLSRASTGIITVRACESENTTEISTSR
jgi:prepilin-type N-terminal cleavage/methylation domain-containing protein